MNNKITYEQNKFNIIGLQQSKWWNKNDSGDMKSKATPPALGWFVKLRLQVIGFELENAPFYKKRKNTNLIQAVSFLFPIPLEVTDNHWKGHMNSPSQKKLTTLNHLVGIHMKHITIHQLISASTLPPSPPENLGHVFNWKTPEKFPAKTNWKNLVKTYFSSWWLNQPLWKIWVKLGSSSPKFGVKRKNIWVATT